LNHLLNFSFAPREGTVQEGYRAKSTKTRSHNKWSHGGVKFNKEHFLQANCQFIVKSSGDYILHTADPDKLVDWNCIEYVRIFMHEVPCCPICLYPPVAGKLTRCGHIYCWPCILHYLSLKEGKTWMKCPICVEAVHENDLKSVHTVLTHSFKVDEDITMNLMKKERGSNNVMKVAEWVDMKEELFHIEDGVDVFHCKLLTASPQTLLNYLLDDIKSLQKELSESFGDPLEASYINYALEQIQKKRSDLLMMKEIEGKTIDEIDVVKKETNDCLPIDISRKSKITIHYESAFDDISTVVSPDETNFVESIIKKTDELLCESSPSSNEEITSSDFSLSSPDEKDNISHLDVVQLPLNDLHVSSPEDLETNFSIKFTPKNSPFFHFYQANDGQRIFLNPLNSKCLLKEFDSWDSCPEILSANILEIEYFTMNEEIRKRWKYLAHLPISCEFIVVELDLKAILSPETMDLFADQIAKRQRIRQKRVHEQNRFDNYAQERERKQWDSYQEAQFFKSRNIPETSQNEVSKSIETDVNVLPHADNASNSPLIQEDPSSKSFAQLLRDGKGIQSKSKVRCVSSAFEGMQLTTTATVVDEDEDYVPPPQYQNSFGDAIQEALNNLNIEKGNSKKKKKNKREKTVLFSTQMARNS